jgi:hypothetical protein
MPDITDVLDDYTTFPQSSDTWTTWKNGQQKENCTNAESVNKIEAVIERAQDYNRQTVGVVETGSVTGDRKLLKLHLNVVLTTTKNFHTYDLIFSAEQLRYLGNDLVRAGNIVMVSVMRRDGTGQYRGSFIPLNSTTLRLRLDTLDNNGSLSAGTYVVSVTVIGG